MLHHIHSYTGAMLMHMHMYLQSENSLYFTLQTICHLRCFSTPHTHAHTCSSIPWPIIFLVLAFHIEIHISHQYVKHVAHRCHAHTHTHMFTHIYTCMQHVAHRCYAHTRTYTYVHTHIYMHTLPYLCLSSWSLSFIYK
jgi:hypothetical protein